MVRTKIVATLGPASSTDTAIRRMLVAGVTVFRINCSHGTQSEHASRIARVRRIARALKRPAAVLVDLQGPKIRTGKLRNGSVVLRRGKQIVLTTVPCIGDEKRVSVDYRALPGQVRRGMTIVLAEGMIRLRVLRVARTDIVCSVTVGGELGERKGVNVVGISLGTAITAKDRRDCAWAIAEKADYLALSFVRCANDIDDLRRLMKRFAPQGTIPVIAKIEKPEAVRLIASLVNSADGVMVARGDLGVEGALEDVPLWQKKIIREANRQDKLVITATQMFESMLTEPLPTRAEVTDVANAIFDGTDAVMLSGETAVGAHPVKAVSMMHRVIRAAERSPFMNVHSDAYDAHDDSAVFSIAHAAAAAAREAHARAIVVFTISGRTARLIAKRRPRVPVIALTPHEAVYRRMSLVWGVMPMHCALGRSMDRVMEQGMRTVVQAKRLHRGDVVVVVFGTSIVSGGTDSMKIIKI